MSNHATARLHRLKVAPARRSPACKSFIETNIDFADAEDRRSPMIGYVVMAFYRDGACNRSTYRPSVREHRVGRDLFDAWAMRSCENALTRDLAIDAARTVHNETHGFDDDPDPAS